MTFSSNLFLPIRLFVLVVGSNWVRVQHRYSIGGKFTYAENKATTTVNLLTGKTNITFQETICTERMVEVEDELRGTSGEIKSKRSTIMEKSSSNRSISKKSLSTDVSIECKICGEFAKYSHFGVVSCNPCKMFFKRNGEHGKDALKCPYNGHCEININNRHVCSYCRLSKCFDCGMQTELIRCSYSKKDKTNQKSASVADAEPVVALKKLTPVKRFMFEQSSLPNCSKHFNAVKPITH
ncbi:unnamed protein product [Rotaria socialis]|uniref:Nuclear receptor domain-containing protein n=1 Tax=Rotaria socialis TaxID=392032 RepID=A0A818ILU7_9BILA|nr:unnamed protein product [Rotaria socialis]